MENVVLTVHLILALCLIGVVLLQRNDGGGGLLGGARAIDKNLVKPGFRQEP
jgi:preprotein translocase subunit SecG